MELKKESFDLVVIGWFINDFQVGIASHFNCPLVISFSAKQNSLIRNYVGNPHGISHIPSPMLPYRGQMNFQQRLINFGAVAMESVMSMVFDYFVQQPLYSKHFPSPKYPTYDESKKNVALILINHHLSQGILEANLPAMVEVGGMHIKSTANELPKVLSELCKRYLSIFNL